VIRPAEVEALSLPYIQYLFLIMLALAVLAIATARIVEHSKLGYGFAAIRTTRWPPRHPACRRSGSSSSLPRCRAP